MKILYLDCGMGAAGDMLTSALLELLPDPDAFIKELNGLGIPGVKFTAEKSVKCGITGTHMSVTVDGEEEGEHHHHHDHEHHHHHHDGHHHEPSHAECHEHHHEHHHHSGMHEIEHIISHLKISDKVRENVLAVYNLIAEAESHAHGKPVTEIHFHEVGTMDAIADVTAVCMLMEKINPDKVCATPVHVGSGHVHCAHGILPVPAPATAYILKDVPIYGGKINGELCTPTGAALLKTFVDTFGEMPVMKTEKIGYGMGKKDFEAANCVRAILGEAENREDVVLELSCNVDDMTGEAISFAMERLFDAGAFEVYTVPIGMKKSRPGTLIRVMCSEAKKDEIVRTIFKHTTTIGIRETVTHRYVLDRHMDTFVTPYGNVRCKTSSGYGVTRRKFEYDDLSKIAREQGISIEDVKKMIKE